MREDAEKVIKISLIKIDKCKDGSLLRQLLIVSVLKNARRSACNENSKTDAHPTTKPDLCLPSNKGLRFVEFAGEIYADIDMTFLSDVELLDEKVIEPNVNLVSSETSEACVSTANASNNAAIDSVTSTVSLSSSDSSSPSVKPDKWRRKRKKGGNENDQPQVDPVRVPGRAIRSRRVTIECEPLGQLNHQSLQGLNSPNAVGTETIISKSERKQERKQRKPKTECCVIN